MRERESVIYSVVQVHYNPTTVINKIMYAQNTTASTSVL